MRAIRPENPADVRILLGDIVSRYSRTSRNEAMRSILRDLRHHFDLDAFVDAVWLNEQLDPPAAAPITPATAPLSPPPAAGPSSPPAASPAARLSASPPSLPPPNTTRAPTRGNVGATERGRALANSDLALGPSRRRRQPSPAFDEETLEETKVRERAERYQAPTMAIDSGPSDARPPAKRPRPDNSNAEIDKKKGERAAGPSKKTLKGRQREWRYVCDVKGCNTSPYGAGDFQAHMRNKHGRRNGWKIHWVNPPEDMFWIAKDEDDEIYTGEMRKA